MNIAEIRALAGRGEGECLCGAARDITSNYADPRGPACSAVAQPFGIGSGASP